MKNLIASNSQKQVLFASRYTLKSDNKMRKFENEADSTKRLKTI